MNLKIPRNHQLLRRSQRGSAVHRHGNIGENECNWKDRGWKSKSRQQFNYFSHRAHFVI